MQSDINKVYVTEVPMTEHQVLEKAAEILACKYVRQDAFCSSEATKDFLRFKLGLLGIRLLAAVLQWSIRRTTIFIDSFGPRFTSFFTASQSILFYSTFRARSSKTP